MYSGTGEKERNKFFRVQREKIAQLKINKAGEEIDVCIPAPALISGLCNFFKLWT